MNTEDYSNLIPLNYLNIALDAKKTRDKKIRLLLEKKKIPIKGWDDITIQQILTDLSKLDSNNFINKCGIGEREARIVCNLVAQRHYHFGHGIGRSGDLLEAQPKAAGSSIMSQLTNCMLLDLIKIMGVRSCKKAILFPLATGMTITLCLLSLKLKRPNAKYVLWSRIDQKACFKCILTAGLTPIIIDTKNHNNELVTNLLEFENQIKLLGAEHILCIFSTTSCFAPRACDDVIELAKISKSNEIPHLINNAYGLQSTFCTHQIEQANRTGRVDFFIQSTDKNLLVPVGGAIVAGFNEEVISNVSKTYPGRGSSSQTIDVFMTLLSLGQEGYLDLVKQRKNVFEFLSQKLLEFADKFDEKLLKVKNNPISLAITLKNIPKEKVSEIGSMLFLRGVSGSRVVTTNEVKCIGDYEFKGWGSHSNELKIPYLTAAAGLGVNKDEIVIFIEKLNKIFETKIK